MNATPGLTKELNEKMLEAHAALEAVAAIRDGEEGAERDGVTVVGRFVTDSDIWFERPISLSPADADAVLALLHDRATARLAALQDEARKALGVPEVSPPVAAPKFKKGDRVRHKTLGCLCDVIKTREQDSLVYVRDVNINSSGGKTTHTFIADDLELIPAPSPLSGDFISEADDARLVRVGKVVEKRRLTSTSPFQVGSIRGTMIQVCPGEDASDGWEFAFEDDATSRLNKEARLTLRTAELTLTADERAKVEAGE